MSACIQCEREFSGPGLACPRCLGTAPAESTAEALPKDRMNQTERRWFDGSIVPRLAAGELLWCEHEALKFRVGEERTWYTPDFPAVRSDGVLEVTEVKGGHIWEDSRVKFQAAAKQYPWIHWRMVQWKGGAWAVLYDYPPTMRGTGR